MSKIRWGILGTGGIARLFAEGLTFLDEAELVAVGSRGAKSAEEFGEQYLVPRRHASYVELANDPEVDVIYVATPHTSHKENSMLCLQAGKAVLCEKPFTLNAREAAELIGYARERKLFLMEAMWPRFLPLMVRLREMLGAGVIGELRMVHADFSFRTDFDPHSRLFDLELGGGALLDAGIYPVSMASMIFGPPSDIVSLTHLGETGADEQTAVTLRYDKGQLAVLTTATRTAGPVDVLIRGTEGSIRILPWWLRATRMLLVRPGQADELIELPIAGNGYNYEAAEVMRCLRAGLTESDLMPLDESLELMRTLDAIRAPWGLKYPGE